MLTTGARRGVWASFGGSCLSSAAIMEKAGWGAPKIHGELLKLGLGDLRAHASARAVPQCYDCFDAAFFLAAAPAMLRCRTASAKRARPSGVSPPRFAAVFLAGVGAAFVPVALSFRSCALRLFASAMRCRPAAVI